MFAGMVRLEKQGRSAPSADIMHPKRHAGQKNGGPAADRKGSHKRLPRRPGYMRAELLGQQQNISEEEGQRHGLTTGETCCAVTDSYCILAQSNPPKLSGACSPTGLRPSTCPRGGSLLSHSLEETSWAQVETHVDASEPRNSQRAGLVPCSPTPYRDVQYSPERHQFNSSFSFIRLSMSPVQGMDASLGSSGQAKPESIPVSPSELTGVPRGQSGLVNEPSGLLSTSYLLSRCSSHQAITSATKSSQEHVFGMESWVINKPEPWDVPVCPTSLTASTSDPRDGLLDLDSCSLDAEAASSLSADSSDAASGSSITSGYESAASCSDRDWDILAKKYEGILQECLQSNRANNKIESMMLKLQGLQQKAVLEDDYDSAERFGKKLEELRRERSTLSLGLPSKHPAVSRFLKRLRASVQRTLQEQAGEGGMIPVSPREERGAPGLNGVQPPLLRRDCLRKQAQLVEEEIQELQHRLAELQQRKEQLEHELLEEKRLQEAEDNDGLALRRCSTAQLHDLARALDDTVTSEHRARISLHPPPAMLRLQEQEQTLNTSIKETTAKVVMSQRLGASLRRKVNESETQLLTLHEAKMAAISGSNFSCAKELKVEMRSVYGERERLEALVKRLQMLSEGSNQELTSMKEERSLLKQELQQREAQFEKALRDDTQKYVELLEDRLHSCGNPAVERVWEADLEACHLLLRGLQLRTTSVCEPEGEEESPGLPRAQHEPDCAMLTALGGRWCPDAGLQHSEFTKKLEEFLFCMEDNQQEDACSDTTDIMEQCESISLRLLSLEEQLQAALLGRDQALAQSLQQEVQEVKGTLQAMLKQLSEQAEDDEEHRGEETGEVETGEEDEDPYFSDSWEI